jgi:hypothetical protein
MKAIIVHPVIDEDGEQLTADEIVEGNPDPNGCFHLSNCDIVVPQGHWRDATVPVEMVVYVNAYEVTRAYGGSEEGGWWYDVGEPLASVPLKVVAIDLLRASSLAEVSKETDRLEKLFATKRRDIKIRVRIESRMAKSFPEHMPQYE